MGEMTSSSNLVAEYPTKSPQTGEQESLGSPKRSLCSHFLNLYQYLFVTSAEVFQNVL